MPIRIKSLCLTPGCGGVAEHRGRCQNCQKLAKPADDRVRYHRDDGWFYSSARWRKARAEQLRRSPLCVECGSLAEHVDHITPRAEGGADLAAENLQSLCSRCHGRKTRAENPR